jgi:DeoR family transcriptional regulator, aga operon transcriptional repressor
VNAARKFASNKLLVEERRRLIVEYIEQHGRATVEELAGHFDVSAVTVRLDLEALARSGSLIRSHGGALAPTGPSIDAPLSVKAKRHQIEKVRIAQAAVRMIHDGETIILDSGTTTAAIASHIRQAKFDSLTVITNALNIAMELSGLSNIRLIMLGGMLREMSYSLVGSAAEQALAKLSADRLFLGVDGLDPQIGVTTPDPLEAELNALMIRVSREVVAATDASKFGRRSLSVIAPVQSLHKIITDRSATPEMVEALRGLGVDVIVV